MVRESEKGMACVWCLSALCGMLWDGGRAVNDVIEALTRAGGRQVHEVRPVMDE